MRSSVALMLSVVMLVAASAAQAQTKINTPPKNPWLIDSVYPTSHHNPAQTDVSPIAGPTKSQRLSVKDVKLVGALFISNPTVKRIGNDRIVIVSSTLGLIKVFATGEAFKPISFLPYPGFEKLAKAATQSAFRKAVQEVDAARRAHDDNKLLALSNKMNAMGFSFRTVANGVYNLIDKDHNHYSVYGGVNVLKASDGGRVRAPLRIVKTVNITEELPPELAKNISRVVGMGMTYDGHIVVAAPGIVALFDRDLKMKGYITIPGEVVDNGIAIDPTGIYVVASKKMYKVVWTGTKLSIDEKDGGWASLYDAMDGAKAVALGALSRGSGTTPTLMGFGSDEDKLVLIADADEKGTKLVAFWRNKIPANFKKIPGAKSRRIAGQIRIDVSYLTIEASPVVLGYGAVVLNVTFPEPSPVRGDIFGNAITAGITRLAPRGIQKFVWDPKANKFSKTWTNLTIDNTDVMVPVVSQKTRLIYVANKVGLRYEYAALDWDTGKLKARFIFPSDSFLYNTWGGIGYFLTDGDLIVGGFFGAKRINFRK